MGAEKNRVKKKNEGSKSVKITVQNAAEKEHRSEDPKGEENTRPAETGRGKNALSP